MNKKTINKHNTIFTIYLRFITNLVSFTFFKLRSHLLLQSFLFLLKSLKDCHVLIFERTKGPLRVIFQFTLFLLNLMILI
jgi:hypothetical protein